MQCLKGSRNTSEKTPSDAKPFLWNSPYAQRKEQKHDGVDRRMPMGIPEMPKMPVGIQKMPKMPTGIHGMPKLKPKPK